MWCLAVEVLIQNLVLIRQNRDLRVRLRPRLLVTGNTVSDLVAANLDGVLTSVALPSKAPARLLLIAFSPGCAYCQENQSKWAAIAEELRSRGNWSILWISRDSTKATRDYCERNRIPLSEVLADPIQNTYRQLGLEEVPQTAVISAAGVVEKAWTGRLTQGLVEDMKHYFDAPL